MVVLETLSPPSGCAGREGSVTVVSGCAGCDGGVTVVPESTGCDAGVIVVSECADCDGGIGITVLSGSAASLIMLQFCQDLLLV